MHSLKVLFCLKKLIEHKDDCHRKIKSLLMRMLQFEYGKTKEACGKLMDYKNYCDRKIKR
jgi:hypothetical protein